MSLFDKDDLKFIETMRRSIDSEDYGEIAGNYNRGRQPGLKVALIMALLNRREINVTLDKSTWSVEITMDENQTEPFVEELNEIDGWKNWVVDSLLAIGCGLERKTIFLLRGLMVFGVKE